MMLALPLCGPNWVWRNLLSPSQLLLLIFLPPWRLLPSYGVIARLSRGFAVVALICYECRRQAVEDGDLPRV